MRYAVGITIVQCLWVARLATDEWLYVSFAVLVVLDLLVPIMAERAGRVRWHPEHIEERYGLFTIIVLGEAVLAATIAFQVALDEGGGDMELLALCMASVIIVFSMWWLYFDHPNREDIPTVRRAFLWGYGHYFIFASVAATGVGIELAIDYKTDHSDLSAILTGLAAAVPVVIYVLGIWALHLLRDARGVLNIAFPAAACVILAGGLTPVTMFVIACALVALLVVVIREAPHIEQHARGSAH